MPSLPTGTVTFLFTDIEGSTTLLQRLGDRRYAEILAEHRRLLRTAFKGGRGQEFGTQGDALLVAFSRARDAVATAFAAQLSLTGHAWPDGTPLRVRMALHTGEPISETGGYVGLDVHRAARICAAGHGGQVLLSRTVADLAALDLPFGVSLRDLGTHRLKDLSESEQLFQVVHPDLPADFPPLKSLAALPKIRPSRATPVGQRAWMTVATLILIALATTGIWQAGLLPTIQMSQPTAAKIANTLGAQLTRIEAGRTDRNPANPAMALKLGPEAKTPQLPPGERYVAQEVLVITLLPEETKLVPFAHTLFPQDVPCADQAIHFTWSLRRPFPANGATIEFFQDDTDLHLSLGTAPRGEGSAGGCVPVSVVNLSKTNVSVEVKHLNSMLNQ